MDWTIVLVASLKHCDQLLNCKGSGGQMKICNEEIVFLLELFFLYAPCVLFKYVKQLNLLGSFLDEENARIYFILCLVLITILGYKILGMFHECWIKSPLNQNYYSVTIISVYRKSQLPQLWLIQLYFSTHANQMLQLQMHTSVFISCTIRFFFIDGLVKYQTSTVYMGTATAGPQA